MGSFPTGDQLPSAPPHQVPFSSAASEDLPISFRERQSSSPEAQDRLPGKQISQLGGRPDPEAEAKQHPSCLSRHEQPGLPGGAGRPNYNSSVTGGVRRLKGSSPGLSGGPSPRSRSCCVQAITGPRRRLARSFPRPPRAACQRVSLPAALPGLLRFIGFSLLVGTAEQETTN